MKKHKVAVIVVALILIGVFLSGILLLFEKGFAKNKNIGQGEVVISQKEAISIASDYCIQYYPQFDYDKYYVAIYSSEEVETSTETENTWVVGYGFKTDELIAGGDGPLVIIDKQTGEVLDAALQK